MANPVQSHTHSLRAPTPNWRAAAEALAALQQRETIRRRLRELRAAGLRIRLSRGVLAETWSCTVLSADGRAVLVHCSREDRLDCIAQVLSALPEVA